MKSDFISKTVNRLHLLYGYAARRTVLAGAPVEYIVETTAKCNLYCPMCPRETHPQPKADMADEIFDAFVRDAGKAAEHVMLIGLGEPFLDPKIFDRIEYCHQHNISTLLSTNGTLLDEEAVEKLLAGPLEHITLSFDGATKESFEFYRKGARYEKVRDNFVRLARMKAEKGAKLHIVVQMVLMSRNANEVDEFIRFWSAVPGVDQVRIKEDETNLFQIGHAPDHFKHPCHYLWRGPMYVKQNGDVYPCCQSYMLDGEPVGRVGEQTLFQIWNSDNMQSLRELHVSGRAGEIEMCSKCCSAIPHPALVAGSLLLDGRTVRRAMPVVERLIRAAKLPRKWLVAARN
jgi:radical SAM protein with 4Fe4S-binding SPASM domain